jgi:hypothetical protein
MKMQTCGVVFNAREITGALIKDCVDLDALIIDLENILFVVELKSDEVIEKCNKLISPYFSINISTFISLLFIHSIGKNSI